MKAPTKPIETVFISASGDRSVGIPSSSFEATVYLDSQDLEELQKVKDDFAQLYGDMVGEKVAVLFDYEVAEIVALEKKMEEEPPFATEAKE